MLGCAAKPPIVPVRDLGAIKIPEIRPSVIAALDARVEPPAAPVSRAKAADWIDRLRLDAQRKAGAGWELVEQVNQCRAPIAALKTAGR